MEHKQIQLRREIIALFCENNCIEDAMSIFFVRETMVLKICKDYGIIPKFYPKNTKISEVNEIVPSTYNIIGLLFDKTLTYEAIAYKFKITKQRVEQINSKCRVAKIPVPKRDI